jgi:peptidoglycan/xylan/chitin deacetylase (PgdA/CDA1 family)
MSLRRSKQLRRVVRWARHYVRPTAVILIYHRVARLDADPYALAVTPEHFSEHLEVLHKYYHPMRLDKLVEAWHARRLPHRAVAVTLDDGYYDCLQHARPLFERHQVPATVFVVSGRVVDRREFWWDELEALLLQPGELPASLRLQVGGQQHVWELGEAARYSQEQWERHRDWNYEMKDAPTERQQVFHSLWRLLHSLPEEEREAIMDELVAWAGADRAPRATHRTLTPEEVPQLAQGGLVEVGAHTVTHPVLSRLTAAAQQRQIERSKSDLETMLGRRVASFSYPHGQPDDYTAETVALVERAGFASACAASGGVVWRDTNRFQLPRNSVPDCDGEAFARRLSELSNIHPRR